jgi:hypothetical protein
VRTVRTVRTRNRLLACEKAGVEPRFEDFDGDDATALALVISLNVQRRDLTAGQRAIVAAKSLPMFEEMAKARMAEGGKRKGGTNNATPHRARDDAARVFKVGSNAVQQAKALRADAPDLAEQVECRALSLAAAYEAMQERDRKAAQKSRHTVKRHGGLVLGGA